jgi:hypothetical protein
MRSESTSALGQPRDTKPTFGLAGAGVVDMSNLGICDASSRKWARRQTGTWRASDQKVRNSSDETLT